MAFGGKINRGTRIDTRRHRRIDPFGPNHGEQAKLLGGRNQQSWRSDFDLFQPAFCGKIARQEMREPDMTPVPRRISGQLVRLYLPGHTLVASAVLGDEAFDDSFPARYAPEVVVDEHGDPDFMDRNGNIVWPEDEVSLFDGDPRKPEGRRKKGWLPRARIRLRRRAARRR